MYTQELIEQVVSEAIEQVAGINITDKENSLIGKNSEIMAVNFLYIFDIIEKQLQLPVCKVFENNSYEVMSIRNLSKAIYMLQSEEM